MKEKANIRTRKLTKPKRSNFSVEAEEASKRTDSIKVSLNKIISQFEKVSNIYKDKIFLDPKKMSIEIKKSHQI